MDSSEVGWWCEDGLDWFAARWCFRVHALAAAHHIGRRAGEPAPCSGWFPPSVEIHGSIRQNTITRRTLVALRYVATHEAIRRWVEQSWGDGVRVSFAVGLDSVNVRVEVE